MQNGITNEYRLDEFIIVDPIAWFHNFLAFHHNYNNKNDINNINI